MGGGEERKGLSTDCGMGKEKEGGEEKPKRISKTIDCFLKTYKDGGA